MFSYKWSANEIVAFIFVSFPFSLCTDEVVLTTSKQFLRVVNTALLLNVINANGSVNKFIIQSSYYRLFCDNSKVTVAKGK